MVVVVTDVVVVGTVVVESVSAVDEGVDVAVVVVLQVSFVVDLCAAVVHSCIYPFLSHHLSWLQALLVSPFR